MPTDVQYAPWGPQHDGPMQAFKDERYWHVCDFTAYCRVQLINIYHIPCGGVLRLVISVCTSLIGIILSVVVCCMCRSIDSVLGRRLSLRNRLFTHAALLPNDSKLLSMFNLRMIQRGRWNFLVAFVKSAVLGRLIRAPGVTRSHGCPAHAVGVSLSRAQLSARTDGWPQKTAVAALYLKVAQVFAKGYRGLFDENEYSNTCAFWAVFANRVWTSHTRLGLTIRLLSRCTPSVVCARAKCIPYSVRNVCMCIVGSPWQLNVDSRVWWCCVLVSRVCWPVCWG